MGAPARGFQRRSMGVQASDAAARKGHEAMTVEIREVMLRARVVGRPEQSAPAAAEPDELKQQILAECEEKIRDALRRQAER